MEHRDRGANTMVVMITSRFSTVGTVQIPGRNYSENFAVAANNVVVIELPDYVETRGSEFVNDNAIYISSRDDISVYMHQYFGMRSEASVVLPVTSVGNSYYVVSYTGVPEGFGPPGSLYPSEFLIVANEDETTVKFTLSGNTQRGLIEGSTQSIVLNRGEVYQVRANDPLIDLTGTFIEGDKDFSLFAGTAWSQVPFGCFAMDNLLEQMYPISTWGTRYVGSSFIGTNEDIFRIIGSVDNTTVRIEGDSGEEIILNAGECYDFQSSSGAYIEGDQPISVAQYITGSGCNGDVGDPSMVILNTVEQIRDTVTLFNSGFFAIDQNFINIICKKGEEDLVFFDGRHLSSEGATFFSIGKDGQFLYTTIPTQVGPHTIYTEGCGIIAMAYGYGNVESYAYSGGASFIDINQNPIPEGGCLSDTILFDTGLPPERFKVQWDLGDGTSTSSHQFSHFYHDLGSYPLSIIVEDLCFDEIDTLYRDIMVTLRQDISVIEDQSGCEGTGITLGAFDLDGARFEWNGPNDYEAEEQFPMISNAQLDQAGLYEVVGNISGCRTFPEELAVEIFANPQPFLGRDTILCTVDGDQFVINAGNYQAYEWQDHSDAQTFTIRAAGEYSVLVEDLNGCIGMDTIVVFPRCPTRVYVPNAFSPNGDGQNDEFGVAGLDVISMKIQVFDRWGQKLFTSTEPDLKWDGNFLGNQVAVGQYIWIMEFEGYTEDGSIFKESRSGAVLLVR